MTMIGFNQNSLAPCYSRSLDYSNFRFYNYFRDSSNVYIDAQHHPRHYMANFDEVEADQDMEQDKPASLYDTLFLMLLLHFPMHSLMLLLKQFLMCHLKTPRMNRHLLKQFLMCHLKTPRMNRHLLKQFLRYHLNIPTMILKFKSLVSFQQSLL